MKRIEKGIRRLTALLLVLLMFPVPYAFAAEDGQVLEVLCRDTFREGTQYTVSILETETGYYITLEEAAAMLGLEPMGDGYITRNRYVQVDADTTGMEQVFYDGRIWYRLEQLMTAMDTGILVAGKELHYVSLPVNQDLMMKETARIMDNQGYDANMLEDMPGIGWITSMAFALDTIWNQRLSALTGRAYGEDVQELLWQLLQHHDTNGSLGEILESSVDHAQQASHTVLKAQEGFEFMYESSESLVPGGGYLLFGIEGSGTLHEIMEANEALEGMHLDLSNVIGTAAMIYQIGKVPGMYADALERVLDLAGEENGVVAREGRKALTLYRNYLEENGLNIVGAAGLITAEDMIYDAAGEKILSLDPLAKIGKWGLEILDDATTHTYKKNDFVRKAYMCVDIQTLFRKVYATCNRSWPDADAALGMRDAATLYLKTAWLAYEGAAFDDTINGAVRMAQRKVDEELILLAGFPDEMFTIQPNAPIAPGSLMLHGMQEPTDGDQDRYHSRFLEFLGREEFVPYIASDTIRDAWRVYFQYGEYYFDDVENDGTDDLVVWLGYTGADGEILVFTCDDDGIAYAGSVPCDGTGTAAFGSDRYTGLVLEEYDGSQAWYRGCYMNFGKLTYEETISNNGAAYADWYVLESQGTLPLEDVPAHQAPPAVQDGSQESYTAFVQNGEFIQYIRDEAHANACLREWMAGLDFISNQYYFYDMDRNGVEELILWLGHTEAEGELMVFTFADGSVCYVDSVVCDGSGTNVCGSADMEGILFAGYAGYMEQLTLCQLVGAGLNVTRDYMIQFEEWTMLEPAGRLQLG